MRIFESFARRSLSCELVRKLDAAGSGDDDSFDSISNFHGVCITELAGLGELYEIDGRLAFAAHVHESHVGAEGNNRPFDRVTFLQGGRLQRRLEHGGKIFLLFFLRGVLVVFLGVARTGHRRSPFG